MSPYYDAVFVGRIYMPEVGGGPIIPPGVPGYPSHPIPPGVGGGPIVPPGYPPEVGGGPIIPGTPEHPWVPPGYPERPAHPWVPPWWGAWQPHPGQPLPRPPYPVDPGWGIPESPPTIGGGPVIPGFPGQLPVFPGYPGNALPGRWQVWPAVAPPEEVGGHPDLPDLNHGQWERVADGKGRPYPAFVPTYIPNVATGDGEDYEPRYPKRGTPGDWVLIMYYGAELAWAWVPEFEGPQVEPPETGTPEHPIAPVPPGEAQPK
jgi:hypothetical protein